MSTYERDPAKRKVRPVEPSQALLELDLGESSDDSDFRIEDHADDSDDCSINTDNDTQGNSASNDGSDSDEEKIKNSTKFGEDLSVVEILERAKTTGDFQFPGNLADMLICAGCLGSRSDDSNEIVECDGCGVTVHEGCYGVSDVTSESSTVSLASTEPWFCEACKAGVENPTCELCPNPGGIFKETEVGAWVHLVCALYVPGVAFSEVEKLSGVTLFEMAYSRWGARACSLCRDTTLARTGVCVGCDAGLCKTFFHVTCGQREGLLAEAHSEEVEQADPFYAHCRMHSDKTLVKKRKRNWLALQLRTEKRRQEIKNNTDTATKLRTQRKLVKYRRKYTAQKLLRNPPWVPTQKMARMIFSSASAMRRFATKAERMGVDTHALELQDTQIAALKDISRRWHIPPAFSVEFIGYYLERNSRVLSLRKSLKKQAQENTLLVADEQKMQAEYEEESKHNKEEIENMNMIKSSLQKLYKAIASIHPNITPPSILDDRPLLPPPPFKPTPKVTPAQLLNRSMSVPTAAALKMGVGFPLSNHPEARQGNVLSTSYGANAGAVGLAARQCSVCSLSSEQHLLAACDTCRNYYHLHCLSPPLQRMPKKSKLYGWQCSECDKSSDSEPDVMQKKVPRRSRTRYSKDGTIISASEPLSPASGPSSPQPLQHTRPKVDASKPDATAEKSIPETKPMKIIPSVKSPESMSPLKMTIKPIEFNGDDSKKEKKIKKRFKADPNGDSSESKKSRKRSFTSPTLTNTPLMSITPLVADSPQDSPNENSNSSTITPATNAIPSEASFLSPNSSFSSLLAPNRTEQENKAMESSIETTIANLSSDIASYKANRKRRKEKHRSRYSPDLLRTPSKSHKHKRKKKSQEPEISHLPRITIKIKTIPKPGGSVETQLFYVPTESNDGPPPDVLNQLEAGESVALVVGPTEPEGSTITEQANERGRQPRGARGATSASAALPPLTHCDVCSAPGDNSNLVRCDECSKRYHFTCCEPPLNRNPKKRGYSWHCADCDPTDAESN